MNVRTVLACVCLAVAAPAVADPAVWRISTADGGRLWLLGSVHYLRATDHPLPPVIDELYERADALVMELDLDDLDPAEVQASFLSAAMLDGDRTLEDVLGPEAYGRAVDRAASFGVDLALLERFEPWLVAVTLMDIGMARRGFRSEHGLEQTLLQDAASDGKPVLGLETIATQIEVFDTLSLAQQGALLEQTLLELESFELMDELVAAWQDGRLDALASTLMQDFEQFPELYESLIVARNRRWADALGELLARREQHLVVVGALHLVGEDSVVELLTMRGFDVEPLE